MIRGNFAIVVNGFGRYGWYLKSVFDSRFAEAINQLGWFTSIMRMKTVKGPG